MGRSRWRSAWLAALGVAVGLGLLACVAHAKTWRKWAPGPLASDSSYAAFLAQPSDSLTAVQLMWLAVQRDWRTERDLESDSPSTLSITETGRPRHVARRTDARFAALVAQPYGALSEAELAWLVAENTAQQVARQSQSSASNAGGVAFVALVVGVLAGISLIGYGLSHAF
jgi:hypothetical protein